MQGEVQIALIFAPSALTNKVVLTQDLLQQSARPNYALEWGRQSAH